MPEAVEVKVRQVGNALGVIIPSRIIKEEKISVGENVTVAIYKHYKVDIRKLLGTARGAPSFEREHGGRN